MPGQTTGFLFTMIIGVGEQALNSMVNFEFASSRFVSEY